MDDFQYINGQLHCENVNLDTLAQDVGSSVYVYSKNTFLDHFNKINTAFSPLKPIICYSVKSCANINILKHLIAAGSGMDVVSGGELYRAVQAGVDLSKVVYAGVGKTDEEITYAIQQNIGWFNIESEAEFENIARIARALGKKANAALRINPDVSDPGTNIKTNTGAKETKFGVDIERARKFFDLYGNDEFLQLNSLHLHIGSPIYSAEPYKRAITKTLALIEELKEKGYTVTALDIGGGFAADYESGKSPNAQEYADTIVPMLQPFVDAGGQVILEPGRSIAANAGVLLTRVQYIKMGGSKKFVICDSGMNHLIRPTLYEGFHFVWPTKTAPNHTPKTRSENMDMPGLETCDVVGPICESGDYLAKGRSLPPVVRGDLLAIFSAGAYGFVMSSNYNTHPRPLEVLVDGNQYQIIRKRETYKDILELECI